MRGRACRCWNARARHGVQHDLVDINRGGSAEKGLRTAVPATRLSDGTIRFLAMLTVLLAPEPSSVVCIEEPAMGLHPDAAILLAQVLVQASRRMQLVVTTTLTLWCRP